MTGRGRSIKKIWSPLWGGKFEPAFGTPVLFSRHTHDTPARFTAFSTDFKPLPRCHLTNGEEVLPPGPLRLFYSPSSYSRLRTSSIIASFVSSASPQIVMLQVCRQGGAHTCHTRDGSDLLTFCSLTFACFALRTEHVRQCVFFSRGQARTQAGESAAAGGKRPPLSAAKVEGYAGLACKCGRWE